MTDQKEKPKEKGASRHWPGKKMLLMLPELLLKNMFKKRHEGLP